MKKILLALAVLLGAWNLELGTCGFAQSSPPNGINYQAVARDVPGNPLSNQTVTVTFRIRQGAAGGVAVYRGTQNYPTNQFGLFNAVIGQTASDSGAFAGITWASTIYFLQVIVNGNNMGSTQLLTVPYAFHSFTADSLTTPPPGGFIWQRTADSVYLGTLLNRVGIGTLSPKRKLHVSSSSPRILVEETGGCSFDIGYNIKTPCNEWILGKEIGAGDAMDLFKIRHINTGFTGFSMTSGKAGIGTNNPQEFFHVRPDVNFTFDSSFVVTAGGKVGIGTIVPGAKLDIAGNIKIADGSQGLGKILISDAAGIGTWQASGFAAFVNMQVFSTVGSFTFTVPAGITKMMVEVWGSGGGGGSVALNAGGGGGGGGYGKEILTVAAGTNYTIAIGSGGTGGAAGSGGTNGAGSNCNGPGGNVSASGGLGGASGNAGGNGGVSANAFNISGQKGHAGGVNSIPNGGDAPSGGAGGVYLNNVAGGNGITPGGGGSGAGGAGAPVGGNGAVGRVVVWW